jgi:hypothetical protein
MEFGGRIGFDPVDSLGRPGETDKFESGNAGRRDPSERRIPAVL